MKAFFTKLYFVPALALIGVLAWYFSAYTGNFKSLWITNDQQAYIYYGNKEYGKAAATFDDMRFKAAAFYRDSDFKAAQRIYQPMDDPVACFDRGNAFVMYGEYARAKAEYEKAIARKTDFTRAKENLSIAVKLLAEKEYIAQHTIAKKKAKGEDVSLSNKEKNHKKQPERKGPKQKMKVPGTALWLDRLHTGPKDFLKKKLSYQYQNEKDGNED